VVVMVSMVLTGMTDSKVPVVTLVSEDPLVKLETQDPLT
jgi:hypothetical protein